MGAKILCTAILLMTATLMGSVTAQTPMRQTDSTSVSGSVPTFVSQTTDSLTLAERELLRQRRIPVKTGDSIVVSATLIDNTVYKGSLWKTLKKVVLPTFVLNGFTKSNRPTEGNQTPLGTQNVGAGLVIIPGSLGQHKNAKQSETYIGLAAYDSAGTLLTTAVDYLSKAARKDWETLRVTYRVERDGFVEVLGQQNQTQVLTAQTKTGNSWINVSKHLSGGKNNTSSLLAGSEMAAYGCTAWYWCTQYGCSFIGISCQENFDGGEVHDGSSGGGALVDEEDKKKKCQECQQKAQAERDANLLLAKTLLVGSVTVGCTTATGETFFAINGAGFWAHAFPGIGTAAIEIVASLGALSVEAGCLYTAFKAFDAAEATLKNNYYKDMRDCDEKFCK